MTVMCFQRLTERLTRQGERFGAGGKAMELYWFDPRGSFFFATPNLHARENHICPYDSLLGTHPLTIPT